MAVVLKPWGVLVYGDDEGRTVVGALPRSLAASGQEDALPRPQPVHRLDAPVRAANAPCGEGSQCTVWGDGARAGSEEPRVKGALPCRAVGPSLVCGIWPGTRAWGEGGSKVQARWHWSE